MPTASPWGEEFLVNSVTAGNQSQPTLTALANGRFLVAWSDESARAPDRSEAAVRIRTFSADGTGIGPDQVLNTTRSGSQSGADLATLSDGRVISVWTDFSGTGADSSLGAIRARLLTPDGGTSGAEFLVNTVTAGTQVGAQTAALSDGRFVVTWTGTDTSGAGIRAQMFTAAGAKSGAEIAVNTTQTGRQDTAAVTGLGNGTFVVTWLDESGTAGDMSGTAVRAQLFAANGSKSGAEFVVATTTAGNQSEPAITALTGGGFVAVWTDSSQTGDDLSGDGLRLQVFNATGTRSGAERQVNTATLFSQFEPDVTALSDGRFVVVWTDTSGEGGDAAPYSVKAQVFDATGAPAGAEFLVNDTTAGNQSTPSVIELADGRIVFAWMDESGTTEDSSGTALRSRIFDPREAAITLSGTESGDEYVGSGFNDRLRGRAGNDTLSGADGRDRLSGDAGNDALSGGAAKDILDGGAGNDRLTGDGGADTFVFAVGNAIDRITDFAGGSDRIDLTAFGFASFEAAVAAFVDSAGRTVLTIGGDVLTVDGVQADQFVAADLLL